MIRSNYRSVLNNMLLDRLFFIGLLLIPIQILHVGPAQLAHLWAMVLIFILILMGRIRVNAKEILFFIAFISFSLIDSFLTDYERIKNVEQIFKFFFIYPVFYLIGRVFGFRYSYEALPFTFYYIILLFFVQYIIQFFEIPFLYQKPPIVKETLHGSFLERNWFAIYFFFLAYVLFLKSKMNRWDIVKFFIIGLMVAFFTESKSILISVGLVYLLQSRKNLDIKFLVFVFGAILYYSLFSAELSGEALQDRIDNERGAAFDASIKLISENPLGYGFGFVESYFSGHYSIMGLGLGVNSVFSSPLDLMIICGYVGLIFWFVFFLGIGLKSFLLVVPIGAWSLVNPLHQSEIVYLFIGFLVSWGLNRHRLIDAHRRYIPSRSH